MLMQKIVGAKKVAHKTCKNMNILIHIMLFFLTILHKILPKVGLQ